MILETIVSTVDREGRPNFAPMGIVPEGEEVILRPFRGSVTWSNLEATGEAVVHFTDDVRIFARCAITPHLPPHRPALKVRTPVLADVCHWREIVVTQSDLGGERARFRGRVVAAGRGRDFAGFNRAKHAVIEATILATRLHLLGRARVLEEIARLRPLVEKTAGPEEQEAFGFITDHVGAWTGEAFHAR
ncbi:MAG: DUF447 domain-containing protein [Candidatus Polarisedimenticolia bacterium]